MRIYNLLLTAALLALLSGIPFVVNAAESAIKVKSTAQTEVETVDKDGKKSIQRIPFTKAVSGTEVIFTTTFENTIDKAAGNININNPIPSNAAYKAGSAYGKDCEILFSIDGGKTFAHAENLKIKSADGKERIALPNEYTHIRWNYKVQLAPGKSGEVGFRVVIK